MDELCAGIDGSKACIDDIILANRSIYDHKINVDRVIQRIKDFGLRLKFETCQFFKSQIKYLGQVIDKYDIKPNPDKICAIQNLKKPDNIHI